MSILRSESIVALNDVIIACREAATQHWTSAEIADNRELEDALRQLSRDRGAAFEDLAREVVDSGDVPNAPAHEKELLSSAVTHVKAALSEDEVARLLDDSDAKEARVVETVRAALGHVEDASLRARLRDLENDAGSRIGELRQRFGVSG